MFSLGSLLCCFFINPYLMSHPLLGEPVSFSGFWKTSVQNHLLGVVGGIIWGLGGCFNFVAAGFVGVPISYAIGQSSPMIAALWGVFVWREFRNADGKAWAFLSAMFIAYLGAVVAIAMAYHG
jgi:glucose uptake protein